MYLSCMLILCMMSYGSFIVSSYLSLLFFEAFFFLLLLLTCRWFWGSLFWKKDLQQCLFNKLSFRVSAITVKNVKLPKKSYGWFISMTLGLLYAVGNAYTLVRWQILNTRQKWGTQKHVSKSCFTKSFCCPSYRLPQLP